MPEVAGVVSLEFTMQIRISRSVLLSFSAAGLLGLLYLSSLFTHLRDHQRYYRHQRTVRSMIDALAERPPESADPERWRRAVEWTSNVIGQDFFAPNPDELMGIERLADDLRKQVQSPVHYETLQWIWEQCEQSCGGPESYAIRFRDVPLLSRDVLTDETLPKAWSLDRCQGIDLSGTPVTDSSIPVLAGQRNLRWVILSGTHVTQAGFERLRESRPELEVTWP